MLNATKLESTKYYPSNPLKRLSFIAKSVLLVTSIFVYNETGLGLLAIAGMVSLNAHFMTFEDTADRNPLNLVDLVVSILLIIFTTILMIIRS
ncbi:hypothetical protein [Furfurilactobacillus rossiae]|uniref:Uncharacterized protein n=1 Tax=Furfurilactobacillus rossiae DSM 15814 TaxID=1114972 RepID=A0A0R1RQF1_9LACO|nr:hypothetical protein [Furfurilactobacillus rossiae]KRL57268.1 hypothetical protein FD35_GL000278 [Furfurilactobacillus rossiae DSM 15814]MCF6164988.1 hypothetical protein [Furfurilactobacillus rossiae]QFR65856.1 hypothetical protein LR814_01495 [Furfurilactobacillus rossiae]QLE61265.1 hypothetical protein LROSRS0_1219 [Furfurilactobacillus rossiae]QLE64059.1 hypothetical protein LROSL1_1242 [Furfurilactobacillus rossiae]